MGEGPLSLLCLGRHRRHSRDIYQAFPLRFCMLRAIKNWDGGGGLGTRQRLNRCQPLQQGLPIHWLAYNTGKAAALEFTFLWGCLFVWVLINVKFVIKLDACIYFMFICYGCYYPDFIELCTRFKGACSTTTPYTHTQDLLKSVHLLNINCMQQQQGLLTKMEELMITSSKKMM